MNKRQGNYTYLANCCLWFTAHCIWQQWYLWDAKQHGTGAPGYLINWCIQMSSMICSPKAEHGSGLPQGDALCSSLLHRNITQQINMEKLIMPTQNKTDRLHLAWENMFLLLTACEIYDTLRASLWITPIFVLQHQTATFMQLPYNDQAV